MAPGISPASAVCCITRSSSPTMARARAILMRSGRRRESPRLLSPLFMGADRQIAGGFWRFARSNPRMAPRRLDHATHLRLGRAGALSHAIRSL
jgi:hypothetical protein